MFTETNSRTLRETTHRRVLLVFILHTRDYPYDVSKTKRIMPYSRLRFMRTRITNTRLTRER